MVFDTYTLVTYPVMIDYDNPLNLKWLTAGEYLVEIKRKYSNTDTTKYYICGDRYAINAIPNMCRQFFNTYEMFECKLERNEELSKSLKTTPQEYYPTNDIDEILTKYYIYTKESLSLRNEDVSKYMHPGKYIPTANLGPILGVDIPSFSYKKGEYITYIDGDAIINMNTLSILDYVADIFDEVYLYKPLLDPPQNLRIWIKMINHESKTLESTDQYRISIPINLNKYISFIMVILSNINYILSIIGNSNWECKADSKEKYSEYMALIFGHEKDK